ncbi:MAG: aldo/keto reductase [Deltaproteobacteria bacterium]|nr:aldo/keto reductase [Deltaproteobacteria bacterium]
MTTFRDRTILGRTGLRVSRLGLASGYGVPDDAVERAFHEHGLNYFYWSSPRRGGMKRALQRLARTHRQELVIALQTYDHTGLVLSRFHERGLRALGIDYADVLILGWFNHYPRERVLDAALSLKAQGKVRFLALSGHRRENFRELLARPSSPIDIFMIRYNAAHRGAEVEVFPHLPAEGRPGITTYTATRWGQLLQERRMPSGERPLSASECYRFVLSHPAVDLCMIGPADGEQLTEAVRALDAGPLSEPDLARVRRIGDHVHG